MIKLLAKQDDIELRQYNEFYAVDKNNKSIGMTLIFTQDKNKAIEFFKNITNIENLEV